MSRVVGVALVLAFGPAAWACLWDDDTLAAESRGLPDVVRIITGRFERNPPFYYAMRRERAAARVASDPDDLEAYDNAGVACDRLGRGDEAIAWMERKAERLDAMGRSHIDPAALREHRYRYLANVGTFWVHRWARDGADRARLDEVRTARDFIAQAIEINPDAHFGRERFQLMALDWILDPPPWKDGERLPGFVDFEDPVNRTDAAVRGIAGLIALGNAWESVDVFNTLAQALEHAGDRSSLAELARLRCEELIDAGRRSLLPGAPTEAEALKQSVYYASKTVGMNMIRARNEIVETYRQLRAEADAWHQARTEFLLARLQAGRHPDTDPHFWNGYHEAEAPEIPEFWAPGYSPAERARARMLNTVGSVLFVLAIVAPFLGLVYVARRAWRGRRKPDKGGAGLADL
jgi:tetratricopeptide (TPR) repeat protein